MSHKKRDRNLNSSTEEENKIFRASKKVMRSPEMEKTLNMSEDEEETRTEKTEREEMREWIQEILSEVRKNREEIRDLKQELRAKEEKWNKEKGCMLERIENLENKLERNEKEKRRNNIIVKGESLDENENKTTLESLFQNKLKVKANVKNFHYKENNPQWKTIWVEIDNWEQKSLIMQNKRLLKGSNVYVEHDLTVDERNTQREIRKIAKAEKDKGKNVKIMYRKLIVEGKVFVWDDREQGLVEPKN